MFSDYIASLQGRTKAPQKDKEVEQSLVSPEQAASMAEDTTYQEAPVPYDAQKEETGVKTSEIEDYRFQPDATLEAPPEENVKNVLGTLRDANVGEMITDAATGLWEWLKGSKANLEGVVNTGNNLAVSNPLALSGTPMAAGMTNAPAPTVTPEQKKAEELYKETTSELNESVAKPIAMVGATGAMVATSAASLGAITLGAGAASFLEASTLLGVPHMLSDTLGSMKKDGMEGAKQTAMNFLPIYGAYQLATSPGYNKYAKEHPGRAAWSLGLNATASLAPYTVPALKLGKAIKSGIDIPDTHPASMLTDIIYDIQKTKKYDLLYENRDVISKIVADTKKEIAPSKLERVESIAKALDANNKAVAAEQQLGFANGGRDIPIGESTLGKPVRVAEIMDTANSLTPVRIGHMTVSKKSVLGYYEVKSDGIRIRDHGEFGVIAHEIGHYLDSVLKIEGHDNELMTNARDVWGDNTYKIKELRGEGIAEFTREYLLNPEEASKNFPGYYKDFVAALAKDGDNAAKIGLLGDQMRMWYKQDPSARARGVMDFYADRKMPTLKEKLEYSKLKAEIDGIDKYAYFNKMVKDIEKEAGIKLSYDENPYYQALALSDLVSSGVEILTNREAKPELMNALRKRFGKDALPNDVLYNDILKPISDIHLNEKYARLLKKGNYRDMHELLGTYLTARHIPEVHAEMQMRFLEKIVEQIKKLDEQLAIVKDPVDVLDIEAKLHIARVKMQRAIKGDFGYKSPMTLEVAAGVVKEAPAEIIAAAKKWDAYMENFRSLAVHFDLLSAKDAKLLSEKYPNYSPLLRVMEKDKVALDVEASFAGSDVFANVSKLYKALSETGSGRDIKDPIEALHLMTSRLIEKGEKNATAKKLVDIDKKVDGMSNYFLKASNKETPNAADLTFSVYDKGKLSIWQATDKMLYDALTYSDKALVSGNFETIKVMGAGILRVGATSSPGFVLGQLFKDSFMMGITHKSKRVFLPVVDTFYGLILRNDKSLMADFDANGVPYKTQTRNLRDVNKAIKKQIGMELEPTAGTVKKLSYWMAEKLGVPLDYVASIGQKIEEAPRLVEMKRLMDEGMSASEAAFYAGDGTINFSRSGVVGQQVNKRTVFVNARIQGANKVWRTLRDNPKQTAIRLVTQGLAPSLGLWAINHNEEWYRKLAPDIKNANWVFRANGITYRIPKPEGYGHFFSAFERMLDYCVDNDIEAPAQFAQYMSTDYLLATMPTIYLPLLSYITNYDFFTQKKIIGIGLEGHSAPYQFDNYTSQFSKTLGSHLEMSPKKLDVAIGAITGTLGKEALATIDKLTADGSNRPEPGLSRMPAFGRFMVDDEKRPFPVTKFYNDYTKILQLKKDTGKMPTNYNNYAAAYRQITRLNQTIRSIETDRRRTPVQKSRDANAKRLIILRIAKNANKKYGGYDY